MGALTPQEEKFLHHLEVLGVPQTRAAELSGISNPATVLQRPDVAIRRQQMRDAVRARVQITKDDVISGLKEAIDHAKLTDEPMAQIAGWREIAKMLGYDAPKQVNVTITGDVKQVRKQISTLTDAELLESLGAEDVIDADFYEIKRLGHP
jgi:phage terminase small subunit